MAEKKSFWNNPARIIGGIVVLIAIIVAFAYILTPTKSDKKGDPPKTYQPVPAPSPKVPEKSDETSKAITENIRFCVYTDYGYAPHADLSLFEGHYVENAKGDGFDFLLCPPDTKGKNVGLDKDQNGKEFIYFKMDTETANILGPFTAWKQVPMQKIKDGEFRYYLVE